MRKGGVLQLAVLANERLSARVKIRKNLQFCNSRLLGLDYLVNTDALARPFFEMRNFFSCANPNPQKSVLP